MGLLDQVLGNALGGQTGQQVNGASPLVMALMALLSSGVPNGRGGVTGGLGGLLGGGMSSGPLVGSDGLGGLVQSFGRAGHGDVLQSWMGPGQNQDISPGQLGEAIGPSRVEELSKQTAMDPGDLLTELSRVLPGVVDGMTPNGRMPDDDELAQW